MVIKVVIYRCRFKKVKIVFLFLFEIESIDKNGAPVKFKKGCRKHRFLMVTTTIRHILKLRYAKRNEHLPAYILDHLDEAKNAGASSWNP